MCMYIYIYTHIHRCQIQHLNCMPDISQASEAAKGRFPGDRPEFQFITMHRSPSCALAQAQECSSRNLS